jgi:hypothetical protein
VPPVLETFEALTAERMWTRVFMRPHARKTCAPHTHVLPLGT